MTEFTVEALPDLSHVADKTILGLVKTLTANLKSIEGAFPDIRKTLDICTDEAKRIGKECEKRLGDRSVSKDERKTLEKLARHAEVVRKRCERIDI